MNPEIKILRNIVKKNATIMNEILTKEKNCMLSLELE